MKVLNFLLIIFISIGFSFGAPVESAKSTIFILLSTTGGASLDSSQIWGKTGVKNYIESNIIKGQGFLYEANYDMVSMSPSVFVDERLAGETVAKSILQKARNKWYEKCQNPAVKAYSLEQLQSARPDLIPSRYILIAEGAAGLAVREYIQSEKYKGEFSNVLFFNTPHEGTGFADQALFNTDRSAIDKPLSTSSLSALVPLILTAYLVDGADGLQEMVINLAKDAVMGMAYDAATINGGVAGLFENYSVNDASLWYLAQDADIGDDAYMKLKDATNLDVSQYVGGTQLLNSYSKKNNFSHPNYNVVYSYGFPTIGNGRRTLDDFVDQRKVHVPNDVVTKLLNDEKLSGYLNGLSELRNVKLNKDDIVGSSKKIISIIEKFIPDEYKSELYSMFIDNLSPSVKSVAGSLKEGMGVVSSSLSSYSLNFFDEGVFDVPSYSAMANNVAAFKEARADRFGVDMGTFVNKHSSDYKELAKYSKLISDVGELEDTRKKVDVGLRFACEASVALGGELAVKACEAAEFATNIGMIAEMSSKIKKIVETSGALKKTKEIALSESVHHKDTSDIYTHNSAKNGKYAYTDIEKMLFGSPQISLASVWLDSADKRLMVPEIFTDTCKTGEIYDGSTMNALCRDSVGGPIYAKTILEENLNYVDFNSARANNNKNIVMKSYGINGPSYTYYNTFSVTNYIKEIHFFVDDLMPRELRWIRLDFNTRFQISYERINDTDWAVYFEKSYQPDEPVDTVSNLIDERGYVVFRPEQVLKKDSVKHPKDFYDLGGLQEDGVNIISVAAMNKLGWVGSAQIPFFFRATEFNLGEGWPRSNEEVSNLKRVYAFINNVGYPYNLIRAGLKVMRKDDKLQDSVGVAFRLLDDKERKGKPLDGKEGKLWIVEADLKHELSNMAISNGNYILDWELMMNDTINGGTSSYHLMTDFYVDTVPPLLSLNVLKNNLTANITEGRWAEVVHDDSVGKWAVRAMRAFILGPNKDTSFVLFKTNTAEYSYGLDWGHLEGEIKEGLSTLVVQAYDFANPDSVKRYELQDIYVDAGRSSWSKVVDDSGKFVSGINGVTLKEKIWIDRSAPEIVDGSFMVDVASASAYDTRPNGANLKKLSGFSLNANDTLKFSLNLKEKYLPERDTTFVKVKTIFKDSQHEVERTYTDVVEYINKQEVSSYRFEEPAANRLEDGIYDVNIEATDEADNVLNKKVFGPVVVDRTAPSVYGSGSLNINPDSVNEIKDVYAKVSHVMDVPTNVGELDCYKRLNAAGNVSRWVGVDAKDGGNTDVEKEYSFSIKDLASSSKPGTWAVYLRCYDIVGNYVEKMVDFFDLGARSPEIIFPDDSVNSLYYGKILVKGIAPNPITKGGNDNYANYRLDWRKVGESAWNTTGFDTIASGVSPAPRTLAIWDVSKLDGDYVLRLSVQGCPDSTSCPWVSTERIVSVYDTLVEDVPDFAPRIEPHVASLVPGAGGKITLRLEHVTDTSKWAVEAKILAQSPQNPNIMAEAGKWTFDPAIVSPFAGKPQILQNGLNVWYDDKDRHWNVVWIGNVQGLGKDSAGRLPPALRLKYVSNNVVFDSKVKAADMEDSLNYVNSMELQGISIPAYDHVSKWDLDGSTLSISFVTDSAFIVDVSLVDSLNRFIHCGASGRSLSEISPVSNATGVIYIHPEQYLMDINWNGLIAGAYPSGDSAVLSVVAYQKSDMSRIALLEFPWRLSLEATKIELASTQTQVMIVGPASNNEESPYAQKKIGLSFGIKGQSAYVTAVVLNPEGDTVSTLMDGSQSLQAGTRNDAYELTWGGINDNSFASAALGKYKVQIVARNGAGDVMDSVEYEFDVRSASHMQDVTMLDSVMKGDFPPVLEIDEAELDENNELRFVGRLDYLMKLSAKGRALQEKNRTFDYKWEWDPNVELPLQAPALWRKYKFSMGIHRHRDEFPVTVVTMLVTKGSDVKCYGGGGSPNQGGGASCSCYDENKKYVYQMNLYEMSFKENGPFLPQRIKIYADNFDRDIMGNLIDENSPIRFAVKVFPHSLYKQIKSLIGNGIGTIALDKISWADILKKEKYDNNSRMALFLNDFGFPLYWEGFTDDFYATGMSRVYLQNKTLVTAGCNVDLSEDAMDEDFVCGPRTPEDEINKDSLLVYNPHINMLSVSIDPIGKTDHFFDGYEKKSFGCKTKIQHRGYPGSEDIVFAVQFHVDSLYWHPKNWGYNNLANRYLRFDPTNITLYGEKGYINTLWCQDSNFYSAASGWKHTFERDSAFITAFEAQRYQFKPTGMNPLLFNDELVAGEDGQVKYYPSNFKWNYFNAGNNVEWLAVAEGETIDGHPFRVSYNSKKPSEASSLETKPIKPLNLSFKIAPVVKAADAFIQDVNKYAVPYPYKGKSTDLSLPKSLESSYKLYQGLVSRVHYGVNDWPEIAWDTLFVINGYIRNPLTDSTAVGGNPLIIASYSSKDAMDSVYHYEVKENEWDSSGYWVIPYDSLKQLVVDESPYGSTYSIPNLKMVLKIMDKEGASNDSWKDSIVNSKRSLVNYGEDVSAHPEYIFSRDSIKIDPSNKSHSIPMQSVIAQNVDDSVIGSPWSRGISILVDSLCYRDSSNKKYPYFVASYNSNTNKFDVHRSGIAPNERVPEVATIRGRVPGVNTKWNIQYTKDGVLHPLASGVQDSLYRDRPYPVLSYFNMSKLQGNTTLFLSYGGDKGFDFYKYIDLHVGTLVPADTVIDVYSMYGNVSVHFEAGAWGEKSTDVTVRSVEVNDYVFPVFNNLAVAGPVIEVLPSHVFPDTVRPVITVTLTRNDVLDNGFNVSDLKIYKPDFSIPELRPLETTIVGYLDSNFTPIQPIDLTDSNWAYVSLKAITSSFSKFLVSDSASVAALVLPDTAAVDTVHFACDENVPMDTLWAGIVNGWLEYPYPCRGKGNYLLQLRAEGRIAAEHQGVYAWPIIWPARINDFYAMADLYEMRANIYGPDGKAAQVHSSVVKVDSVVPVIDDVEVTVTEEENSRKLHVGAILSDVGSGVAQTTLELYFGGSLLVSETVMGDSVFTRTFTIDGKTLYGCIGCQATVKVITQDHGHNSAKRSVVSDKLYPYPMSLVLWYPLQEGFGSVAYEWMGTGVNLDLSNLYVPWGDRQGLTIRRSNVPAVGVSTLPETPASPFSVEMKLRSEYKNGIIATWDGPNGWSIGTDDMGRYYIDYGNKRKTFNVSKSEYAYVHLVWVFDGRSVSLYRDGLLEETATLDASLVWTGNGKPVIGSFEGTSSASFGIMDLRIYTSALTANQISPLYNGVLDIDEGQIYVVRATDLENRNGLVVDQSCALAGKSYLRQRTQNSDGIMDWLVDADADNYTLYILSRGYAGEDSRIEVLVNGVSKGVYKMSSSGYWESQQIGTQAFNLIGGRNSVSIRPIGNVGVAGLALISASKAVPAEKVNYGEGDWKSPAPRVEVNMRYSPTDGKTINPMFQVRNMTPENLYSVRLRYYYKGEGESVHAVSYHPGAMMSVVPDAGDVFYAELVIPDAIMGYDRAYGGNGPQLGLNRIPNHQFWNIYDDPSYVAGASMGYVKAVGVALLDDDGNLLNEWSCYDADGGLVKPKKEARILVADERHGDAENSTISMVVENTGSAPIDGFESRYYFRDESGNQQVDIYSNIFAESNVVHAGGNLYYVSFMYPEVILNPGEKSDYENGVKFAMYNPVNPKNYNAYDDPSYSRIVASREFVVADSAIVLDLHGNLLWGNAPRPIFSDDYVVGDNRKELVNRNGDVIYVTIENDGRYVLEIVNAAGLPQGVLFNGTWSEGEHTVSLANYSFNAGSYLVLRQDNTILSWQILK